MTLLLCGALVLAVWLLLLSLIENSITILSAVDLRVLLEKAERPPMLLQRLVQDRTEVLVPLQFSIQLTEIALAVLGTYIAFSYGIRHSLLAAFFVLSLCVLLLRQLIPKLIVHDSPERVFLFIIPLFEPVFRAINWIGWPLLASLALTRRRTAAREEGEPEEEPSEEEIQAFLEVGEEEGILEEHDSELIQSVVEFGDTLVREVMTPRAEMVTISQQATLQELKDLMVTSKHSRIPVYAEMPEQIAGVISVRPLLAEYTPETAHDPILPLISPVMFTPESKRVRELLKELQQAGDYMAVVVNEYGEVAGLVTVEDLVEEIVGEIRDKDEREKDSVVYEGLHQYRLRGDVSVSELEDLLGLNIDKTEFTTISGWLVNLLGRVPQAGETLYPVGLKVEILNADPLRIHQLRVSRLEGAAEGATQ